MKRIIPGAILDQSKGLFLPNYGRQTDPQRSSEKVFEMMNRTRRSTRLATSTAMLALAMTLAGVTAASAGETEAKALLKAMSDYMVAQKTISMSYDNSFEVVSKDKQKLQVAASGKIDMSRPDKLRATRTGGFANVEMVFDGKTFTILGKDANVYVQAELPGTVDQMVDVVRDKYHKSIPGAENIFTIMAPVGS